MMKEIYPTLAMETVNFQAEDGITTGVKLPGEKL